MVETSIHELIDRKTGDITRDITELKVIGKEANVRLENLCGDINELVATCRNIDDRVKQLEEYRHKQDATNETHEKSRKHLWVKVTALILLFEALGVGLGLYIAHTN